MKTSKWSVYDIPIYLLLGSMLFVPIVYKYPKGVLMLLAIFFAFAKMAGTRRNLIHPIVSLWTIICVITGIIFVSYGLINGNPGPLNVATVYILWPIVFIVIFCTMNKLKNFDHILRIIVICTILISLYCFSYIMNAAGYLPDIFYIDLGMDPGVTMENGFVEFRMYSLSSLIFLVPCLVAILIIWPKNVELPIARKWIYAALFLALLLALISSRKGFMIIVFISPFVALLFNQFQKNGRVSLLKYGLSAFGILLIAVPIIYLILTNLFDYDFAVQLNDFKQGFDFSNYSDESSYVRRQQFFSLLKGWESNILLGQGHGGVADVIRSDEQPWAYELAYLALLFHTGLIGFSIYVLAFGWVIWQSIRIIRSGSILGYYVIPILTGTICFMIANATNPYLEKFDYIWIIFLPISVINFWLREQKKVSKKSLNDKFTRYNNS